MSGRLIAIFLPSDKCPGKLGTTVLFSLFQARGETHSAVPWGKQWRKGVIWSSWTDPSSAGLYFSFPAVISMRNTQIPEVPSASHWPSGALTVQTAMGSPLSSGADNSPSWVAATFLFSWQVSQALVPCLGSSKGSIPSLVHCLAQEAASPPLPSASQKKLLGPSPPSRLPRADNRNTAEQRGSITLNKMQGVKALLSLTREIQKAHCKSMPRSHCRVWEPRCFFSTHHYCNDATALLQFCLPLSSVPGHEQQLSHDAYLLCALQLHFAAFWHLPAQPLLSMTQPFLPLPALHLQTLHTASLGILS